MQSDMDFYADYDRTISLICKPYDRFLEVGAKAIPRDVRGVCDLGIGTGNFSLAIRRVLPHVVVYGIDKNRDLLEIACSKIPGLQTSERDLFDGEFPKADYIVSSLTTHHFDSETRRDKLAGIVSSANGFVNFDMMLFNGYNFDDVIERIAEFGRIHYSKSELDTLIKSARENDNPMPLEEQRELFESMGLKFDVLARDFPFVVYHTFWPNKKE